MELFYLKLKEVDEHKNLIFYIIKNHIYLKIRWSHNFSLNRSFGFAMILKNYYFIITLIRSDPRDYQ